MGAQLSIVSTENNENANAVENEVSFESFWLLYPRKEAKKDTMKAWSQIPRSTWPAVITATANWRREWAQRDTRHIPLAASWLRGERWEDELPQEVHVTAAAHQPMKQNEPFVKSELPQHVRDMLAKMKRQ